MEDCWIKGLALIKSRVVVSRWWVVSCDYKQVWGFNINKTSPLSYVKCTYNCGKKKILHSDGRIWSRVLTCWHIKTFLSQLNWLWRVEELQKIQKDFQCFLSCASIFYLRWNGNQKNSQIGLPKNFNNSFLHYVFW